MSPFVSAKASGSPFQRGTMWKWMCLTVWPAASPLFCRMLKPSQPSFSFMCAATFFTRGMPQAAGNHPPKGPPARHFAGAPRSLSFMEMTRETPFSCCETP